MSSAHDPASFDKNVLQCIWSDCPACVLTGLPFDEFHHCHGRSGLLKSNDKRKLYSSPYNAVPLSRLAHSQCPILNDIDMRNALTTFVMRRVQDAIRRGDYRQTDDDVLFLSLIGRM